MSRRLEHIPTHERTDEELERAFDAYMQSKMVNGRFCPTPDVCCADALGGEHDDGGREGFERTRSNVRELPYDSVSST